METHSKRGRRDNDQSKTTEARSTRVQNKDLAVQKAEAAAEMDHYRRPATWPVAQMKELCRMTLWSRNLETLGHRPSTMTWGFLSGDV